MVCNLKVIRTFTNVYIAYSAATRTFTTFFVNVNPGVKILVADMGKNLLYSINNTNGKVHLTNEVGDVGKRTCFQYCMDYCENQIADDFIGWAAWNLSPGVQLACAIGCARACR